MKNRNHNEPPESKLSIDFEALFQTQDPALLSCYESHPQDPLECDEDLLHPILNSLTTNIERYEEINFIAEGGEKKISRVHDRHLNRYVAMARSVQIATKEQKEQFLREARLEANLAHPNIMPVFNIGLDHDQNPFFTMELVPGDSLKTILKQFHEGKKTRNRDFSFHSLLYIYLKICDAIAYAHSRNVLHLDIKPDNIRIGQFGEVFVCDWGLAKIIFDEKNPIPPDSLGEIDGDVLNDISLTGTIKGSPGFMAPEQTISNKEITRQTDIYALGALLYAMLTNQLPVAGNSATEIIKNTQKGNIIPPRRRKPDLKIPTSLAAVAMKALALDPADRYTDVTELRQEIQRYLSGHPTLAENPNIITTFSLLVQRHGRTTFLLIFFLLLISGIMSLGLVVIQEEKLHAEKAQRQSEMNLTLYRNGQKKVTQLNDDLREAIVSTIRSPTIMRLDLTLRVLESGISKDLSPKQYRDLMAKKGSVHFMLDQFNAANECFEEAGDSTRYIKVIRKLSKHYATIKPNDATPLSSKQFADLIHDSKQTNVRTTLILYYMYLHHIQNNANLTPETYLPLAGAMLNKLGNTNIPLDSSRLTKTEKGYHLDLANTRFSTYTLKIDAAYNKNILEPLNLYSLDISYTPLASAQELNGLKLKELKIVGLHLPPKNLPARIDSMGVETLILDIAAYPKGTISRLRRKSKVINEQLKPRPRSTRKNTRNQPKSEYTNKNNIGGDATGTGTATKKRNEI
jgi:serine/threonine protein kinase